MRRQFLFLLSLGIAAICSSLRAQSLVFTNLAGGVGGGGYDDGQGKAARFSVPTGVAVDRTGNVYVADNFNSTIRKVAPDGNVTTLAGLAGSNGSAEGRGGAARFNYPSALAIDSAGNTYVTDQGNSTIRKITSAGVVTTLAGLAGFPGSSDGIGSAARFLGPSGIAIDNSGNLYVADTGNSTIRKITPTGLVTTLAGSAASDGDDDGTGSAARFSSPTDVAIDSGGNIYVADTENQTIRKITPAGVVTTFAGSAGLDGDDDGTGASARFSNPTGVTVDGAGNIYVADSDNSTIRKITPAGVVTTLAGIAGLEGSVDATGIAARFNRPWSVAVDGATNLYVADTFNFTIRKITAARVVTTLAGTPTTPGSNDGTRSAARFNAPEGLAVDTDGNAYITDSENATIRRISPAGIVTTFAGIAGSEGSADGTGSAARFSGPSGVAMDRAGNLYVADTYNSTIRKITPAGTVTTFAGDAESQGIDDGMGNAARFSLPLGVATDGVGNVYVADTGNCTIRKITPAGIVSTIAGNAGTPGASDGIGAQATFFLPYGLAVDDAGNVYVADSLNFTIRKITPAGNVTTLAGLAGSPGSSDGTGSAARFYFPTGLTLDRTGNLYVADAANSTIRKITPGGAVTTLAGSASSFGSTAGTGSDVRFYFPFALAMDASGALFVSDTGNHAIRVGRTPIADVATVDLDSVNVGSSRQLDTSPHTATSWEWTVIRRPSGSTALLSSSFIRNPSFIPDVADGYQFRLFAHNASGDSITIASLRGPSSRHRAVH